LKGGHLREFAANTDLGTSLPLGCLFTLVAKHGLSPMVEDS
jgi:hypothetical protein